MNAQSETAQALERLRQELVEHDRSGRPETPFTIGIRQALELEAGAGVEQSGTAA